MRKKYILYSLVFLVLISLAAPYTGIYNSVMANYYLNNGEYYNSVPYLKKAVIYTSDVDDKKRTYARAMTIFQALELDYRGVELSAHMLEEGIYVPQANLYLALNLISRENPDLYHYQQALNYLEPVKDEFDTIYNDILLAKEEYRRNMEIKRLREQRKREIEEASSLSSLLMPDSIIDLIPISKGFKIIKRGVKISRLRRALKSLPSVSYSRARALSVSGKSNIELLSKKSKDALNKYNNCIKSGKDNCDRFLYVDVYIE